MRGPRANDTIDLRVSHQDFRATDPMRTLIVTKLRKFLPANTMMPLESNIYFTVTTPAKTP
jgi:hypothetical protein